MKKLLIFAMAALAFVACKPQQEQPDQTKLSLNESEITVKKDATFQLTANLDVTWTSANEKVATVSAGLVKGIAKGETTITAESKDGQKAACKVIVTDDGEENPPVDVDTYKDFAQLQGSAYYVLFLQEGATKYLGDKVLYNFGPNDNAGQGSRWLYTWDNTFVGGTAVGTDPFDMAEGWVAMAQVTSGTWAGMGLCVAINDGNNPTGEGAADDLAALNELQKNITNYDEWYFAVALKNSVQGAGYDFNLIGSNVFDAATNKGVETGVGTLNIAPAATGEWVYKEYKLSEIPGLEFGQFTSNGSNILTILGNPYMSGTQLDLGYAFLYKK